MNKRSCTFVSKKQSESFSYRKLYPHIYLPRLECETLPKGSLSGPWTDDAEVTATPAILAVSLPSFLLLFLSVFTVFTNSERKQ